MSFRILHDVIYERLSALIERRPGVGYIFSTISGAGGLIGLVETATKIVGFASVVIGLIVGIYTLRIQRRVWEDKQAEHSRRQRR